jgi:hypothetical protein
MGIAHSALLIARSQFAFTMAFHIVRVAFTIGLSSYLVVLEALWLWKKQQVYIDVYNDWLRIFALNFAVDRKDRAREVMVDSILPVWDGNETRLVLGGGELDARRPNGS